MDSSLTPFALPHALMTKASLLAMKMIWSTPAALNLSRFSRYDVTCFSWHVGVKAPGTATRTTFLDWNSVFPVGKRRRLEIGGFMGGVLWEREGGGVVYTLACIVLDGQTAGCEVEGAGGVDVGEGYAFGEGGAGLEAGHF